jgi:UDP-N-acetylmuramate--alanine ligase
MIDLSDHHRIHLVGIGGIGMSALARYLHARGFAVSGSDRAANEQTDGLRALGMRVEIGHDAVHLGDADLVVASSAVASSNPELVAAKERGVPVIKRSVLLAAIMNPMTGIAVAGTHGKSTTSALIAHLLLAGGLDVTALIGGVSTNLGSNARVGESKLVVVEADEYDASFLQLRPTIAVITNAEADHLDFYGTVERIHDAFRRFAESVEGTLVICADDPVLPSLADGTQARIITYGIDGGDWQAQGIAESQGRTEFTVTRGAKQYRMSMPLAGRFNVLNALAAVIVAVQFDVPMESIARGLATFAGVRRRFEVKGEAGGVLVMDDYAHHPSEIRVNLTAMRERFGRPIRVIFQPHTYSRTFTLLGDFEGAFAGADAVYLTDIYAAREENIWGIHGEDLAEAVGRRHCAVRYTESLDATLERVVDEARPGDLVVTMGAGNVDQLGPRILERLGSAPEAISPSIGTR